MGLTAETREIIQAVERLNGKGKWITLQQCLAMLEHEIYQKEGQAPEIRKEGNIIFPKWDRGTA